jgi:nucleoside-diphosphate-sugar epimerase
MAKTAFVTGATGFVGLNLVEHLREAGWQVIALRRQQSDLGPLADWGVETVEGDITDLRSLRAGLPQSVDAVFHLAGNTSLWTRLRSEQMRVNVKGTRNIVRAALDARAGVLVHVSSIVAYGLHGGTITEQTPTRGTVSPIHYVRSKALAEREVRRGISAGLRGVIINPANIVGAYDTHNWARLFKLVRQGRVPAMPPGGGSFCHAREVARVLAVAAEKGRSGHNYLLGGAQATYAELVRRIAAQIGVRRRVVAVSPRLLTGYARLEEWLALLFRREPDVTRETIALLSGNLYCSSRKAQQELGYQPQPLERMLEDCHRWLVGSGRL